MLTRQQWQETRDRALAMLAEARIALTPEEKQNFEVAEFGLNDLEQTGLEIVTYINTSIYCAKELILFPYQTCPEHRHPMINGRPGKMETFRCRSGIVYLYITGAPAASIKARVPKGSEPYYTVFHEIVLKPGEQFTIPPDTLHWFQAGAEGAIVSEFSSTSFDEGDIFTDTRIKRMPEIAD